MALLAFDTATAGCAVCVLLADGTVVEERPGPQRLFNQPAHTGELLPAVDRVLQEASVSYDDLTAVAVGVGPGAFTGLRIGVATARAIAAARDLPLTPVSSLAALARAAFAAEPQTGPAVVMPVNDARRQEFFCAGYGPAGAVLHGDCVCPATDLLATAGKLAELGELMAVGDGAVLLRDELAAAGAAVPARDDIRHMVSAEQIARIATDEQPVAVNNVLPNYIRQPDAKQSSRESWVATATGGGSRTGGERS